MKAKEMLKRLQASGYGDFPDRQLRTLQRRVREWRKQIARQLIYGSEALLVAAEAEASQPVV
jgi:hypothetical protein